MPTDRAPRGAKLLANKVLELIEEYPLPKQIEVTTWLSGHLRTEIAPELRRQMKAEAKVGVTSTRTARSPATRGTMSMTKRSLAGKKAAATRKARGTQRGGRPARQNSESHAGIEATDQAPAYS